MLPLGISLRNSIYCLMTSSVTLPVLTTKYARARMASTILALQSPELLLQPTSAATKQCGFAVVCHPHKVILQIMDRVCRFPVARDLDCLKCPPMYGAFIFVYSKELLVIDVHSQDSFRTNHRSKSPGFWRCCCGFSRLLAKNSSVAIRAPGNLSE